MPHPLAAWCPRVRVPPVYVALVLAYTLSRFALFALGLRFNAELDWMFLADPAELRSQLFKTLVYFHVYPPGMNLITGLLLKLSSSHFALLAHGVFCGFGVVLTTSLFYIASRLGISRRSAFVLAFGFSLIPQSLYFENLYLYTYPVASLVCVATACLHHALRRPSLRAWLLFFGICATLAWLRTTFHLFWLLCMLALALSLSETRARKTVLVAALVPFSFVALIYLKNYALFDSFGATSAASGNFAHVTYMQLSKAERRQWVQQGKLSRVANVSVYAPPKAYLKYFGSSVSARWPQISHLEKPSTGRPNYNHWFFMEANRQRSLAAQIYLREHLPDYFNTVGLGLHQIFEPSTSWHPTDKPNQDGSFDVDRARNSPHYKHHQALGMYVSWYNRLVHQFPVDGIGLYSFLPVVLAWAAWRGVSLIRNGQVRKSRRARAELGVLVFALFQILFVISVSALFTIGESERYRYQLESLIWLLVTVAGARTLQSLIGSRRPERG